MLSGKGPSRPRCCDGVSVLVKLHAPVGCEAACDDDRSSAARWDGRRIVYVDGSSGTFELYVMNADGTAKHHVARGDEPSWSPDGKKVAFLADPAIQRSPPAKENPEIYVVNADGTGLRRLTNNRIQDQAPLWSPDGKMIAFFTVRNGDGEVYVMNADGSDQRSVSRNPARSDVLFDWSP